MSSEAELTDGDYSFSSSGVGEVEDKEGKSEDGDGDLVWVPPSVGKP